MHYTFRYAMIIGFLMTQAAHAGVGKVSTPHVEKNEFEIEYNGRRTGDNERADNNNQRHLLEVEYGVSDAWQIGLEFEARRSATSQLGLQAYGVETQYELTTQNTWWLASALKAEYLLPADAGDASEGELLLLLQRDQGLIRLVANIELAREFGDNRDGGVELETALQGIYRWNKHLSPGVEWFAEYGNIDNFNSTNRQEHFLGPMLKGELFELGNGEIGYEAGYYWGLTDSSADNAQRIKLSYELEF